MIKLKSICLCILLLVFEINFYSLKANYLKTLARELRSSDNEMFVL